MKLMLDQVCSKFLRVSSCLLSLTACAKQNEARRIANESSGKLLGKGVYEKSK